MTEQEKKELFDLLLLETNNNDSEGLVICALRTLNSDLAVRKVERLKALLAKL